MSPWSNEKRKTREWLRTMWTKSSKISRPSAANWWRSSRTPEWTLQQQPQQVKVFHLAAVSYLAKSRLHQCSLLHLFFLSCSSACFSFLSLFQSFLSSDLLGVSFPSSPSLSLLPRVTYECYLFFMGWLVWCELLQTTYHSVLRILGPGVDPRPGQSVTSSPSCSSFPFGLVDKWVHGEGKL